MANIKRESDRNRGKAASKTIGKAAGRAAKPVPNRVARKSANRAAKAAPNRVARKAASKTVKRAAKREGRTEKTIIQLKGIGRDYQNGDSLLTVLDGIDLRISQGDFAAITGPSGSGKSTLLALLAGLDRPTRGKLWIDGQEITALSEDRLSLLRGQKIGFVFQSFQLISTLTALENVRVPAELQGNFDLAAEARDILGGVGLSERADHYPSQLSGGEMQRVAIARASITRPSILLADEPTGNLDSVSGQMIMDLLVRLNRSSTLVLVTHNRRLAALADYEIGLKDGRIDSIVSHSAK